MLLEKELDNVETKVIKAKFICKCPFCSDDILDVDYIDREDENFNSLYECSNCETIVDDYGDIYEEEYYDELECSRCGSSDLQNFGGCYICNDCGLEENII